MLATWIEVTSQQQDTPTRSRSACDLPAGGEVVRLVAALIEINRMLTPLDRSDAKGRKFLPETGRWFAKRTGWGQLHSIETDLAPPAQG